MSSLKTVLVIIFLIVVKISAEELFCARDRPLLLGGVFNYDKVLFAYSWKEGNSVNNVQLWLVWRYEIRSNRLVAIGKDTSMDQVFPDIPLFRTGFGLTIKCDQNDNKCKSYRQLVFVFFHSFYRVYRFANDVFSAERDRSKIPWNLSPRGEIKNWSFNDPSIEDLNAIAFISGYQSQLFILTRTYLMVSAVDVNADKLRWSQVAKSGDFNNVLGAFVIGSEIFFNKNEAPENVLLKYDQSGKELERISVWKYFNCDNSQGSDDQISDRMASGEDESDSEQDDDTSLATSLLIGIGVVIVITNLVAGVFWLSVYRKKSAEPQSDYA